MTIESELLAQYGSFSLLYRREKDRVINIYFTLMQLCSMDEESSSTEHQDPMLAFRAARKWARRAGAKDQIRNLFHHQPNWRFHIIAGVAVLYRRDADLVEDLWQTIDNGSFVSPQLCAVASIIDPNFRENAERRFSEWHAVLRTMSAEQLQKEFTLSLDPCFRHIFKPYTGLFGASEGMPELAGFIAGNGVADRIARWHSKYRFFRDDDFVDLSREWKKRAQELLTLVPV